MTDPSTPINVDRILANATEALTALSQLRGRPDVEHSMACTVAAFNGITGTQITDRAGWRFLSLLTKVFCAAGEYSADNYAVTAGYTDVARGGDPRGHALPSPELTAREAAFDAALGDIQRLIGLLARRQLRPGHDC